MPTNTKRTRPKIKTIDRRGVDPAEPVAEEAPPETPTPEPEAEPELALVAEKDFNPFEGGLVRYCREGRFMPMGGNVLAYGIMPGDHNALGLGKEGESIGQGLFDTRTSIAWRVEAVGADVPKGLLEPGMCFKHLSATAAPVDGQDKSCRWHIIWYNDVIGAVWPDEEVEIEDPETGEITKEIRPSGPAHHQGEEVINVVGAYPWRAEQMNGKAWRVLDGEGDVMAESISQQKAEAIADRVNMKAGMQAVGTEQHAGATIAVADRPKPEAIRTEAPTEDVDGAHLLEGLGADEVPTMLALLRSRQLEAAEAIYPNLLKMSQNKEAVDAVAEKHDTNIAHLPGAVQKTIMEIEAALGLEAALEYKADWEDKNIEKKKSSRVAPSPLSRPRRRTSSR